MNENAATTVGNYLNAYGEPVLATQMPYQPDNVIGGYLQAIAWTCRWIKALAPDAEPIYTEGKLRWVHGGRSLAARPTHWIVWEWDNFKTVPHGFFNSAYTPVEFTGEGE
jgi:hypothetical protein